MYLVFWLLTGLGFYLLFYSNFVFIVLLYDKKYQKSARRTRAVLLSNHRGVHELVARSSAWRVRAAQDKTKIGSLAFPAISYYHACEHSARESRADSCTHCLHARIIGLAGVSQVCALTGLWLIAGRKLTDSRKRTRSASPSAMQAQTHLQ